MYSTTRVIGSSERRNLRIAVATLPLVQSGVEGGSFGLRVGAPPGIWVHALSMSYEDVFIAL